MQVVSATLSELDQAELAGGLWLGLDRIFGSEVPDKGYARQGMISDHVHKPSGVTFTNMGTIDFGPALEHWGVISGWSIWDAREGGQRMVRGKWAASKTILGDDRPSIKPGWRQPLLARFLNLLFGRPMPPLPPEAYGPPTGGDVFRVGPGALAFEFDGVSVIRLGGTPYYLVEANR